MLPLLDLQDLVIVCFSFLYFVRSAGGCAEEAQEQDEALFIHSYPLVFNDKATDKQVT